MATQTDRCSVFATEFNLCQLSFRELLMAAYPGACALVVCAQSGDTGCSPDDIDRYIGKYGSRRHRAKDHVVRVDRWVAVTRGTASSAREGFD